MEGCGDDCFSAQLFQLHRATLDWPVWQRPSLLDNSVFAVQNYLERRCRGLNWGDTGGWKLNLEKLIQEYNTIKATNSFLVSSEPLLQHFYKWYMLAHWLLEVKKRKWSEKVKFMHFPQGELICQFLNWDLCTGQAIHGILCEFKFISTKSQHVACSLLILPNFVQKYTGHMCSVLCRLAKI